MAATRICAGAVTGDCANAFRGRRAFDVDRVASLLGVDFVAPLAAVTDPQTRHIARAAQIQVLLVALVETTGNRDGLLGLSLIHI